jgi:ubiquinone/menaquinone biosynthesis C-methylase UbiE
MNNRIDNRANDCLQEGVDLPFKDNIGDIFEDKRLNISETSDSSLVPEYLRETYYWCYLNPRNVARLDREIVVKTILWLQHKKLQQAAFSEIPPGSSVLQPAAVYGHFSKNLAQHVGTNGKLKVIDVAPIQVRNTLAKLANYPQAEVCLANAATLDDAAYDVVLCYFLLHEIPDDYKVKVIDNLLRNIKPDGKLVFIDYHKPHWAHPLKPITSLVFDTLEPFAKTLWRKSIRNLASEPERYEWRQSTYFGGLFQKVVVQHKPD